MEQWRGLSTLSTKAGLVSRNDALGREEKGTPWQRLLSINRKRLRVQPIENLHRGAEVGEESFGWSALARQDRAFS